MKLFDKYLKYILTFWLMVLWIPAGPIQAETDDPTQSDRQTPTQKKESAEKLVSIDFNNVDINVLIKFISELSGENFVIDQRVKGKVTIISPSKITVHEAYKVFESVLEVHGYTTVRAGKVIKIVPSPDARSKNIETRIKEEASSPADKVVTQLIPLQYADPAEIKKLFAPLVSKSSVVLDYTPTNMLIVTDVYSNIQRLLKILEAIDVTGIGQELSIVNLRHSDAKDLVKTLESVFSSPAQRAGKKSAGDKRINFVADDRTNTLIVMASKGDTDRIKELIEILDRETPKGKETIHVYYLENAMAEDLAKVLQDLPTKEGAAKAEPKTAPVISTRVKITADKSTNSLIIMAGKEDYQFLEGVIKKLDIPRSMVYIECVIMEVNVEKDFNLGTEWTALGTGQVDNYPAYYGGGFSGQDPGYSNIAGLGGGLAGVGSFPTGFSLGVFSEFVEIDGVKFPSLAAIVQAYKKDKDVHILSTPQILTTDNEEATINVGKNVPYQTRSAAEGGVDTYSSYEYRDVGILLKITPHISKDKFVRLNVYQEVTKLDELASTLAADRPTTLKRTIETTVIVDDQNTVVIGGLIDEGFSRTVNKVPCLGDIPMLGWLFRANAESQERGNLYVFLTPRVIKGPEEAADIYDKKKKEIDEIEEKSIKMYNSDILKDPGEKSDAE